MSTVSNITRVEAWAELGESFRLNRYYQGMLKKQRHKLFWYRIVMGALTTLALSLEFLVLLTGFLARIPNIAVLCAVVLYYIEDSLKISRKVNVLAEVVVGFNALDSEWKDFWSEIETYTVDERMTRFKLNQLNRRKDALLSATDVATMSTNDNLNSECTEMSNLDLRNFKELCVVSTNP